MLYPQNGGRIVAIDSVTSFHPMYTSCSSLLFLVNVLKHAIAHKDGAT